MTIPELPKDLIEEILCYVPATYLKRLRSTCKEWNRLFKDDRRFERKHFDKAAKQCLPLISTKYHKVPCLMSLNLHGIMPSLEVESKIRRVDSDSKYPISTKMENSRVFHCGGLLLCSSQDDESAILVWNPLTGENRWIKTGNRRDKGRTFVLGYYYQEDKKPCYKILSFYSDSNDFEIFEFNSDSWRFIDDICPGWSLPNPCQCVSLKGKTYMFALDETKTCVSLLKYDYSTEKSILVPLPYKSRCFEETSLSVVREEKLSVLLQRDKSCKTEIWVTNETTTKAMVVSWSKVLALDLSPLLEIWYDGSFFLEEEKKVIMISNRWIEEDKSEDNLYIVGEDANKATQVYTIDGCGSAVYNYVPSLVQIERARGKRKRVDS
ncbi:unnamed protein product [Arabidopsis lyrata]|uniref:F-box domain-containing protein n=1 Tax=Arabidopsis lyrata subsp. lyrata TaxID=81972 RepID=D7L9Z0_ARALL|nr:putative F-box/kelch-repeat protein At3g19410 [Arabidopsis lyrata subsp. lyrata]EFH59439.1 hypothetical protein ARALYDRAFT_898319 [Arabidopsis lyrata subsp. lyrata]CAH8261053.1 unnamed protein product [Arabidopsis lyrata]|eukprot:XP_002883180.1 putative F-box/kelch-repeat protein At3g19410 [Arabidopsis lyrata subsp. lyrata]